MTTSKLALQDREVVDEYRSSDGGLFALAIRITGSYTLQEIRKLLEADLLPCASEMLRRGACRAVFFEPETVQFSEGHAQNIFDEVLVANMGQSGTRSEYFSRRSDNKNPSSCLHTHVRYECTSSLFTENGSVPSMFIADEEEFEEAIVSNSQCLSDSISESVLSVHGDTVRDRNVAMCRVLQNEHSNGNWDDLCALQNLHSLVVPNLRGVVRRQPQVGQICVFAGDVVHLADMYTNKCNQEPGEVFAQHWRKKPR